MEKHDTPIKNHSHDKHFSDTEQLREPPA